MEQPKQGGEEPRQIFEPSKLKRRFSVDGLNYPRMRSRRRLIVVVILIAVAIVFLFLAGRSFLTHASTVRYQPATAIAAKQPKAIAGAAISNDDVSTDGNAAERDASLVILSGELSKLSSLLTTWRSRAFDGGSGTVVREIVHVGGGSLDTSAFVSRSLFDNQVDATHRSMESMVDGLTESIDTATLTVAGNASVDGVLTAATLSLPNSLTLPNFTPGSILYIGSAGLLAEDNDALIFDAANGRLGIGTNSPSAKLDVSGFINTDHDGGYKQGGNIALYTSTTSSSLAVGADSAAIWLHASSTPSWDSIAIGSGALATMPTGGMGTYNANGVNNIAIGVNALNANSNGYDNVAIGRSSGAGNTNENRNVSIGSQAYQYGNAHALTAVGFRAAYGGNAHVGITGTDNTAIGAVSLYENTTGEQNTSVGAHNMSANTTGSYNTSVGYNSLVNNISGTRNIALGYVALYGNTTGSTNVAVGYDVLTNNTTGNGNIAIGASTGKGIVSGSYNVVIGSSVSGLASGLSNNIIIADGQGNRRINIDSSGNVGIGTTSPSAQLHTTGPVRFANFGAGTLETDAIGNLSVSSDETLKQDIVAYVRSIDDLLLIEPISFRWRPGTGLDTENVYTGFSAQNVRLALPEAVGIDGNGKLTLSDRPILAAVVNAVKALYRQITDSADTVAGFAVSFSSQEVTTGRLCVDDICVTRDAFRAMVEAAGTNSVPASPAPAEDEPAVEATIDDQPVEVEEPVATSTPIAALPVPISEETETPTVALPDADDNGLPADLAEDAL